MKNYLEFEHNIKILEEELNKLKDPFNKEGISEVDTKKISQIESEINSKLKETYANLNEWQKTQVARHEERPKAKFFIDNLFTDFINLSGDRRFAEDESVLVGFALFGSNSVLVIGQEKGDNLDSRLKRNFGMMKPEGYRKCIRLMKLADKYNIPVISFVDTPGAYPGIGAEQRGQAEAIASSIECCMSLRVPIISIIIGEGGSGGAIALASANKVLMLENAIYSVISPEGCASILWRDPSKSLEAAKAMKLTANELLKIHIIDEIIQEPIGGAHRDKEQVISSTKVTLMRRLEEFKNYTREEIFEQRRKKFLDVGRQKSFTSFAKNLSSLVKKDNFFITIKENCLKYKNKLIIVFLLLLVMGLFLLNSL
ncbi:MAG TPA: acetyl-CoA carboxylase carboxyltransferase subunit alpha [Pelagibacteraceae bacterium]|jgi:acetyl-CoA carboxylase carboxyl transferase subunit alpha|nr:acetyl-CoA carboxylase carboxyltransferase subunit alpha [Pelagibacteraceae bacterium]|tara:strand:- start:505 stop:1614 length:1110 start_codon:yes stop_codon:yes gene_type:complete